jgi:hypothetical protein
MLRRPPKAARAFLRSATTRPSSVSMRTSPFSNTPRLPGAGCGVSTARGSLVETVPV